MTTLMISLQHLAVLRKLVLIDGAEELNDLMVPPGNRLEELKGNRDGQHFGSMINGVFALIGLIVMHITLK